MVRQRRQFHLQHAFTGARAVSENLKDQAGSVQQLDAPFLFQIALLHGANRAIDQNKVDLFVFEQSFNLFHLARAKQQARRNLRQAHNLRAYHIQPR